MVVAAAVDLDVVGPSSSTNNAVVRFDGTTGKLIKNSGVLVSDTNNVSGVVDLDTTGDITAGGQLEALGNFFAQLDATLAGDTAIGDTSANTLNVIARIISDLIPSTTNARDLGSDSLRWKDIYAAGNVIIGSQNSLRLQDTTGGEYVGLRASGTQTTYTITFPSSAPGSNTFLKYNGADYVWSAEAGTGDVVGPASATDNAVVRFDLTTGKLIKNSGVIIDNSNNVSGIVNLTTSGVNLGANGSNTAPTYSFSGDTNTGFYRRTTDQIGIACAGEEVGYLVS